MILRLFKAHIYNKSSRRELTVIKHSKSNIHTSRLLMKPLNKTASKALLERISHGTDAQIKSITPKTATSFELRMSVQDANRAYDWIDIIFLFDGVNDARLLEDVQLVHVEMTEGISLIYESGEVAFALGEVNHMSRAKESTLFIRAQSLKYEETHFSGM